ncbi:hypothetical protein J6590_035743 [Homalodisca vitripennis]|nr:hypothetical protein J6590_035743 [Homalodisca vitripennis]
MDDIEVEKRVVFFQHDGAPPHYSNRVHMVLDFRFPGSIQCNAKGDWHIPYVVKEDLPHNVRVDNYHRHWLCLSSQPSQQSSGSYNKRKQPVSHNRPKVVLKSLFDS